MFVNRISIQACTLLVSYGTVKQIYLGSVSLGQAQADKLQWVCHIFGRALIKSIQIHSIKSSHVQLCLTRPFSVDLEIGF